MFKHLSAAIMAMLPIVCVAQEVWTYSDCLDYAREHNISIMKSQLNQRTSEYNLEESKAQWQPTLDFATTHGVTNYPWGEGDKTAYSSTYGLNAAWTVWNGGRRENTIRQNKLRADIDRLGTADLLRSPEADLLQVYFNILYARESIGIYEEAVKVSRAQAERACQLMEAGKISRVDYVQLNSQFEQDKYALVMAGGTAATASEQVLAALPPVDESYALALKTDLRLQELDLEKAASKLDIAIAGAARLPQISLSAGVGSGYYAPGMAFGSSMKRNLSENIGLTLSIPILDGKKTKTAVARARVAELDAQLDIDQRRTELAQLVENWYIDTRSAQSRYTAALSRLESAELSDRLTNERFELGYVNTVELLTAHNAVVEARHSLLQAKYMAMLGQKMIEFYRTAEVKFPE